MHETESARRSASLKLVDHVRDKTTVVSFRHFLESHGVGGVLLKQVNQYWENNGRIFREGSIVHATIIAAPSSAKNKTGQCDPGMHQIRKGNQ